ncbi:MULTISPECIES: RusA family crossover junction endodeoxyribonuclease [Alphaproteobacteria]|uniref:RusA family crossover junction endodeoxyribonuclease n=1 Tax=Alphaproteobacteria TaxID=28211 RepID=UPI003264D400
MTITLLGEPRSTSHIYKYTCRSGFAQGYMSEEGKALKEDYQWQARSQFHGEPLGGPLSVSLTLYHRTKRKADIDNFNKLVLDALTEIVWEDDHQIERLIVERAYDKERPRTELLIKPVHVRRAMTRLGS